MHQSYFGSLDGKLIVVIRRFFDRSGRHVDLIISLEPRPASVAFVEFSHSERRGKEQRDAPGCRSHVHVYIYVYVLRAFVFCKKNRENQREDAALFPISPDIFPDAKMNARK